MATATGTLGFANVETLDVILSKIKEQWEWAIHHNERPNAFLILGSPGIGKTMGIYSLMEGKKGPMVVVPASTVEPPDIAGAMKPEQNIFRYLPPEWAEPLLEKNLKDEWAILFIDDISAAARQVQTAIFKLVHEGQFGPSNKLGKNVLYILAGNRPEDEAGAQKILTPLGSRCHMFTAKPSHEAWLDISLKKKFHPTIRGSIMAMPDLLNDFNPKLLANPCPRTWEIASKVFYATEFAGRKPGPSDLEGVVGTAATSKLFTFLSASKDMLYPKDIVANPLKVKMPEKLDAYYLTCASLEAFAVENTKYILPVLDFVCREDSKAMDIAAMVGARVIDAYANQNMNNMAEANKLFSSPQFTGYIKRYPAMLKLSQHLRGLKKAR